MPTATKSSVDRLVDGNEYVNLVMSYEPLILGHGDERVREALRADD